MYMSKQQKDLLRQADQILKKAGLNSDGQPKRKGAWWQRKFENRMAKAPFGSSR